jgi:hypothetical protein
VTKAWFFLGLALSGSVSAQGIHITGSTSCGGLLELVNSGPSMRGESSGRAVRIQITDAGVDHLPVVLSLRTNCVYRIAAEWTGAADTHVRIAEATISPANGTGSLTVNALHGTVMAADLSPGVPAVCVAGRPVSRGGNNTTTDNAVLIQFVVEVPPGTAGAAFAFTLCLGS